MRSLEKYKREHRLEYYEPYPFQKAFHHAKKGEVYPSGDYDLRGGDISEERALICGNQIGKTHSAAMEVVFHATGLYPDWWEGIRFDKHISIGVGGKRNESVRDVCQNELCGDPFEETAFGTGAIPKHLMGKPTRKAGVPNALSALMVKHKDGMYSKIRFMAFEQGPDAFMGIRFDYAWLDEEPPADILSQIKRSMLSKKKKSIGSTFTPEEGITNVVDEYLNHMKPHQAVVRASWDDAAHMTDEKREEHLSQFPLHEREMRMKGIPFMGSGLIFPVNDEDISVDPFNIPAHWPRICGIDFGYDHPFAAVWIAWDRETDTYYVYDCFRVAGKVPPIHSSAVKQRGLWIPVAWPHDGLQHDKGSGIPLADQYRKEGLRLLPEKFSNPPSPGQKEGQGGNGVEVGLFAILTKMETGTFKVFSTLGEWFEEKNMYHRKEGKIDKVRDDIMSACFHPDTRVITSNGIEKISDLTSGMVLTIDGKYTEFNNCRVTRRDADLVKVIFEDGLEVECTADHEFLTDNGWTRASYLIGETCYNSVSHRGDNGCLSNFQKQKFGLMGRFIQSSITITERASLFFIEIFGLSLMARYLKSTTSTIKTAIQKIMPSKTLNAFFARSTFQIIKKDTQDRQYGLMKRKRNGESLKKAKNSSVIQELRTRILCSMQKSQKTVSNAVMNLRLNPLARIDFALVSVNQNGVEIPGSITLKESVDAEKNSSQINTVKQSHALEAAALKVVAVEKSGKSDVWCMSVPETEAFSLSNGAIVHNCRYAAQSIRFAATQPTPIVRKSKRKGIKNW